MSINFNNSFTPPYFDPSNDFQWEELPELDDLEKNMELIADRPPPTPLEKFQNDMELFLSGDVDACSSILQSEQDKDFANLFLNIWRADSPRTQEKGRMCLTVSNYKKYLGKQNHQSNFFMRVSGLLAAEGPCERYVLFLWLSYLLPAYKGSRFGGLSNFLNILPTLLNRMKHEELGFVNVCNTTEYLIYRDSYRENRNTYLPDVSPSFVTLLYKWMCAIENRKLSEFESFFKNLGYSIRITVNGPQVWNLNSIPHLNFENLVKNYLSTSQDESDYSNALENEIFIRTASIYSDSFLSLLKEYKECKFNGFQRLENCTVELPKDHKIQAVFGLNPDAMTLELYGYGSIFSKILLHSFLSPENSYFGGINNFIKLLPIFFDDLLFFDGSRNQFRINVDNKTSCKNKPTITFFEFLYNWMKSEGMLNLLPMLFRKRGFDYNSFGQPPEVYRLEKKRINEIPNINFPITEPMVIDDEIAGEGVQEKDPSIQKSLKDYLLEQKDQVLKIYSQLVKILKTSWFSSDSLKGTVVQTLIRSQGKWQLSIESEKELEALLAPLEPFIKKGQRDQVTKEILKDIFSFFPISCPNFDIPKEIAAYIFESEKTTGPLLSEKISNEVAQSFLNLKISEFLLRSLHLENFFQRELKEPRQIPCFLIEQDKNQVHADLMMAHFNQHNSLIALTADPEKVAVDYLKNQDRHVQIQLDDEGCTSTFSLDTLKNLRLSISLSQGIPSALFLQRVAITDALALDTIENKKPAKIKEENFPEKPRIKKRKREEVIDEKGNDILGELTETKKKKNDDNNSTFQAKSKTGYSGLELQGAYKSFLEAPDISNRMDIEKDSSKLEGVPTLPSTKKKEAIIPEKELDLINFWEQTTLLALETIESKVAEQEVLSQALQSKALDYPILESLEALQRSKVEDVPCFNPLLKLYQRQEINQILHFAKMKISRLLAFEMGLGKTFVFSEFISQILAQREGIIFVVVPKSLLDPVSHEISRAITLSLAHAYKALGKTEKVLNGIVTEVKICLEKEDKERLKPLVQLFSLFKQEELKVQLATHGCFEEKYNSTWTHLKEVLSKTLARLTDKPDLIKNAISAALAKSQNISRLPSRKSENRTEWEKQLLQAQKEPLKWLAENLETFCDSCRDDLFFEQCSLIGRLLEIADGFEMGQFPKEKLERFTNFSTKKIVSCHKFSELTENLKLPGSRVLITTHEKLTKINLEELKQLPISSIIVDEAQKLHKEGTDAHQFYQKLTRGFSKEKRPAFLFASGTPIENHFSELYTLLDLCNPQEFSVSTYNTLKVLFEETKKGLIQEVRKSKSKIDFEESLIRSFAQFQIFRRLIVQTMIGRLNKSSPQVISAWKNLIPKRIDHQIEGHMSREALQAFQRLENNQKTLNHFEFAKNSKVVLLDPALTGSFSLKNQEIQQTIIDLKTPEFDPKDLFQRSPLLHSLLDSDAFKEAINNKQRSVIVTEHRATAKIIKYAISRKFFISTSDIKVFHGSLSAEKRDAKIKWFRENTTDRSKFFILMAKAGGVGLNLPEGNKVFMANMDWNPAVDEQVVARVLRVGNAGEKHIYWINYNMFFQQQQKAIQESKKMLENFFFSAEDSLKSQFAAWCKLLESSCYHACLNHTRDLGEATVQRKEMQDLLQEKMDQTSDVKLQQAIDGCSPKKTAAVTTDYPQLTTKECVIIPTTIANGSWVKTVAFGYALKLCMKNQPDQMKKLLKDLNNAFCKNPEWRQQIRENSFMDTTGFINKNLMAIKAKRPSENEPFLQTDFRVEFYQSTADGKLVCYSIHNENKKDVIRLYKKTIGETKHYDLISLF